MPLLRSILLPLLLVGCASHAGSLATGAIVPGRPLGMSPGESVRLPSGEALRYIGVRDDSRCPPAVQCIRAGDATVEFRFTSRAGTTDEISLNTARQPTVAAVGGWRLQLVSLAPGAAPRAVVQLDPAD